MQEAAKSSILEIARAHLRLDSSVGDAHKTPVIFLPRLKCLIPSLKALESSLPVTPQHEHSTHKKEPCMTLNGQIFTLKMNPIAAQLANESYVEAKVVKGAKESG
jgi:hypothetical protein